MFDASEIDETEMHRGLFDYAELHYFTVNWADLSQGILRLRRGRLGEVSATNHGIFNAEMRGLVQGMRQSIVPTITPDCTADVGDGAYGGRCHVPIYPLVVARSTAYELGDHVRATNSSPLGYISFTTGSNLGFETGDLTGWSTTLGTPLVTGSKDGTLPYSGSYFVTGTDAAGSWTITQTMGLDTDLNTTKIDNGDYLLSLDFKVASVSTTISDTTIRVEFLTAADAFISDAINVGPQGMGLNDVWGRLEQHNIPIPATARKLRITVTSTAAVSTGGSCVDEIEFWAVDTLDTTILEARPGGVNPRYEIGANHTDDSNLGWTKEGSADPRSIHLADSNTPPYYGAKADAWMILHPVQGSQQTTSKVFTVDDVFSATDIDAGLVTLRSPVAVLVNNVGKTYRIELEALDGSGNLIRSMRDTGAAVVASTLTWYEVLYENVLPTGTRQVRMSLTGINGVYFDIDTVVLSHSSRVFDSGNYDDRIYEVTTAGTTAGVQPAFNTTLSATTADGSVVFTAREAWSRTVEVVAVDSGDPRRIFTVSELTPNSGGSIIGRDYFPDDAMNGGVVTWETGANAGVAMEVRDFAADDGVTIEQDVTLYLDMPFDIQVGDRARIYRGCNGTRPICRDIFANMLDFRGFPDVPGQDFITTYPDAT